LWYENLKNEALALVGPQGRRKNAICWSVLPGGSSVLYYEIRYEKKFYNWYLFSEDEELNWQK